MTILTLSPCNVGYCRPGMCWILLSMSALYIWNCPLFILLCGISPPRFALLRFFSSKGLPHYPNTFIVEWPYTANHYCKKLLPSLQIQFNFSHIFPTVQYLPPPLSNSLTYIFLAQIYDSLDNFCTQFEPDPLFIFPDASFRANVELGTHSHTWKM